MAGRQEVQVELATPPRRVGILAWDGSRRPGTTSFRYEEEWLRDRRSFAIDPTLPLVPGELHTRRLPGVLRDAAPDRWGRLLQDRREQIEARRQGRAPRALGDWEYLLGVQDETRMGGLRLRDQAGTYLASERLPVPPLASLHEVQRLARAIDDETPPEGDPAAWVSMLIAPGSSLGGARPKATFRDPDGSLWMAKFPARGDTRDVEAWEMVLNRLALVAGIPVPESRLLRLGPGRHTFSARRFDRESSGRRLFMSAMTLTGKDDMEPASYLDVAAGLEQYADPAHLGEDLAQLFRRVVFNVSTGHRDDHLRNHGLLHGPGGWRLAPAYDLNPVPEAAVHALALDEVMTAPSLDAVRVTAELYRLRPPEADRIIAEVTRAVDGWADVARGLQLSGAEIANVATAFLTRRDPS